MATADVVAKAFISDRQNLHCSQLGSDLQFRLVGWTHYLSNIALGMSLNVTKIPDWPVSIGSIILAS